MRAHGQKAIAAGGGVVSLFDCHRPIQPFAFPLITHPPPLLPPLLPPHMYGGQT